MSSAWTCNQMANTSTTKLSLQYDMISICIWKVAQILTPSKSHDKGSLFDPQPYPPLRNYDYKSFQTNPTKHTKLWHLWERWIKFLSKLITSMEMCPFVDATASLHLIILVCQSGFIYFTNLYFCWVGQFCAQFEHSLHTVFQTLTAQIARMDYFDLVF